MKFARRGLAGLVLVVSTVGVGAAAGPAETIVVRMHGSVEPVRSQPVFVPRLSGSGVNSVVITHLTKPGTQVKLIVRWLPRQPR